jgi:hypothetical protein
MFDPEIIKLINEQLCAERATVLQRSFDVLSDSAKPTARLKRMRQPYPKICFEDQQLPLTDIRQDSESSQILAMSIMFVVIFLRRMIYVKLTPTLRSYRLSHL